jgi:hypothetical protein
MWDIHVSHHCDWLRCDYGETPPFICLFWIRMCYCPPTHQTSNVSHGFIYQNVVVFMASSLHSMTWSTTFWCTKTRWYFFEFDSSTPGFIKKFISAFISVLSIPVVCLNKKDKTQMFVVLTVIHKHLCYLFYFSLLCCWDTPQLLTLQFTFMTSLLIILFISHWCI